MATVRRLVDSNHWADSSKNEVPTATTGPSLTRAPVWLSGRLGKDYLYFSYNMGNSIQLAYSNDLGEQWQVFMPGILPLSDAMECQDYIAYPDVHVEDATH